MNDVAPYLKAAADAGEDRAEARPLTQPMARSGTAHFVRVKPTPDDRRPATVSARVRARARDYSFWGRGGFKREGRAAAGEGRAKVRARCLSGLPQLMMAAPPSPEQGRHQQRVHPAGNVTDCDAIEKHLGDAGRQKRAR